MAYKLKYTGEEVDELLTKIIELEEQVQILLPEDFNEDFNNDFAI